jgi:hypothetical protein
MRKTGKEWADELGVQILEPRGWNSVESFESLLITRLEFCNRAAASVLKVEQATSRREAAKMLQKYKERNATPKTQNLGQAK